MKQLIKIGIKKITNYTDYLTILLLKNIIYLLVQWALWTTILQYRSDLLLPEVVSSDCKFTSFFLYTGEYCCLL